MRSITCFMANFRCVRAPLGRSKRWECLVVVCQTLDFALTQGGGNARLAMKFEVLRKSRTGMAASATVAVYAPRPDRSHANRRLSAGLLAGALGASECSRPCQRPAAKAASLDLESDTFGAVQHYIRNCRRWKLASEVR